MPRPKPRTGSANWSRRPQRHLTANERRVLLSHVEPEASAAEMLCAEIERWLFAWYPGAVRAARTAPGVRTQRGRPRRDELIHLIRGLLQIFHRFRSDRDNESWYRPEGVGSMRPGLSLVEGRESEFVAAALVIAGIPHIGRRDVKARTPDDLILHVHAPPLNTVRRYRAKASPPSPETRAALIEAIARKVNQARR